MSAWLPYVGSPLHHGPLTTFFAAFAISPGIPALLALTLERRVMKGRREFVAFYYGDPLLALAAATGVALSGPSPQASVLHLIAGPVPLILMACWLAFGAWQWKAELRAGMYTPAQAWSPTKIWHQMVVYPVLGYMVTATVVAGMATPTGFAGTWAKMLIVGCVLVWILANVHDRRHPKLGHPPYDWRRLKPVPQPWPLKSTTLRANRRICD
ncbi:hypothetical protein [Streptomyces apocyni]|uniref:hypothetical protein n=1 Tax=Streptomyces apocyni TaxID=2654677 RepID=UPI0012E9A34C|nr:hypothetical protein [Streptomyces apocyni]